ncbi:YfbR-like 5'-deoxynucleotidase [Numidum massiliense]|uniref:YfbR-like 5'-deoxynucleotidase n=1 Tax=Numidum massiliense TaxID=1522315 RepID=UPI0006D54E8E|nr:YfbR-like 5'-deoxynucleotidase [Numidum massiliense]
MQNGKFINIVTRMQYVPRWDEYAPKFEDNTASHSYRCAVYGLIAALIEQKQYGKDPDVLKIVCRAIFHDLNEVITGPIKHRTKKSEEVREHIYRLEKEASTEIVSYLSQSLQPIFTDFIVCAEDDSYEGQLVDGVDTFDAMMFCHREVLYGSTYFFADKYEELADKLRRHHLPSIRTLMAAVDAGDELYDFLFSVLMLDRVRRWKGKVNTVYDDDAIHGFRSTALGIFNSYLEKIKYGVEIDILAVVGKLLGHDIVEEVTGDVLGPVKHSSPEIKRAFEAYERKVNLDLVHKLPPYMHEAFISYTVEAKENTYEGKMVDLVDKLDALIKVNMERRNNPSEYEYVYRHQLRVVQQTYEQPSAVFFLAYILHDLEFPTFD